MLRINVTVSAPDPGLIGRAGALLREGGIAAIPTDTLYGLAVNPFDPAAVAKLFTIKNRAIEKAVPLVASDLNQVRSWIGMLPTIAERLADRFWPGPLTLVVAAPAALAPEVTGGGGTVGIRIPAHEVTRALCAAAGTPLTATSANISGRPSTDDPDVVAAQLGLQIDLIVDAGRTPGGAPSTIVDVSGEEPRLIRAGAIEWHAVLAATTTG